MNERVPGRVESDNRRIPKVIMIEPEIPRFVSGFDANLEKKNYWKNIMNFVFF